MAKVLAGVASAESTRSPYVGHPLRAADGARDDPTRADVHSAQAHLGAHATGDDGSGLTDFKPEQQLPVVAEVRSPSPVRGTRARRSSRPTRTSTAPSQCFGSRVDLLHQPDGAHRRSKAGPAGIRRQHPVQGCRPAEVCSRHHGDQPAGQRGHQFGFNSSGFQEAHRELLDPKLREAFEYALRESRSSARSSAGKPSPGRASCPDGPATG